MATVELTGENLEELIENSEYLLIDFWAEWCAPCRFFGPIFEKASEKYPDMTFAKCDTEAAQDVAAAFGIRSIPTLGIFREKVLLFLQPGALQEEMLESVIQQVRALDMDEVRKEVEAHEKEHDHEHHHDHEGHQHN